MSATLQSHHHDKASSAWWHHPQRERVERAVPFMKSLFLGRQS